MISNSTLDRLEMVMKGDRPNPAQLTNAFDWSRSPQGSLFWSREAASPVLSKTAKNILRKAIRQFKAALLIDNIRPSRPVRKIYTMRRNLDGVRSRERVALRVEDIQSDGVRPLQPNRRRRNRAAPEPPLIIGGRLRR